MKKKLLIFHPIIAPYRIDYFNALAVHYDMTMCLFWRNLHDQTFDYKKIEEQFLFKPTYVVREEIGTKRWLAELWRMLSKKRPDIVYVCEYGPSTILTLIHRFVSRAKYKIICGTDDSYNMLTTDNHFTKRHERALKLMASRMDEIINVEPRVAQWYQKRYGKGIYFPIICDDIIARERLQRVLPISQKYLYDYNLENKKILLFVGRLVALKNIDFAIKAFVKADISDSVFVIVGSGKEETNLKGLARQYANVKLVGRFEGDGLYAWYNIAHVFTLPSIQEPFGAVTNEALVAGCMCLISKDAGSNCLIENGKNGYTIDPRDENAYTEKLRQLMNHISLQKVSLELKKNQMTSTFMEHIVRLQREIDTL